MVLATMFSTEMERDAEVVRVLRSQMSRCMARFVGRDGLQHLCDEYPHHRVKHYCFVHNVLEAFG
jgi:hypothetical protein